MARQWLMQQGNGSYVVLCSEPPGKRDKGLAAQATHIIDIPDEEALNHYDELPEAAVLIGDNNDNPSQ